MTELELVQQLHPEGWVWWLCVGLSDSLVWVIGGLWCYAAWQLRQQRPSPWALRWWGFSLQVMVVELLKWGIGRERPFSIAGELGLGLDSLPSSASMPSGHAASALYWVLVLGAVLPRPWRAVALLWAVGVGASRVLLGVHYLSDVLVGWLIAVAFGLVVRASEARLAAALHRQPRLWLALGLLSFVLVQLIF